MENNTQKKIILINNQKTSIENIGSKVILRKFNLPKYPISKDNFETLKKNGNIRIIKKTFLPMKSLNNKIEQFPTSANVSNTCPITIKSSDNNLIPGRKLILKPIRPKKNENIQIKKRKLDNDEVIESITKSTIRNNESSNDEETNRVDSKDNTKVMNIFTNEVFQELIENEINSFKKGDENTNESTNETTNSQTNISSILTKKTEPKSCQTDIHSLIIPGHFVEKERKNGNELITLNDTQLINLPSTCPSNDDERLKLKIFYEYRSSFYQDESGNYQLHKAVINEDLNFVKRQCMILKARNSTIDLKNHKNETPLHIAILWANLDIVKLLLEYGADISMVDKQGNNAIHLSILSDDSKILKHLLKYQEKIQIDAFNDDGLSSLHLAAKLKKYDECKMLINSGANVNLKDKRSGRTPIFHAIESLSFDIIELLLCTGASKSVPNFAGITPYTFANEITDESRIQIIKILNEYVNPNVEVIYKNHSKKNFRYSRN